MSIIIDNNKLEVRPCARNKRKVSAPLPSVYTNPALDLLASDDPIDNTKMEVRPPKKRKRTWSNGEVTTFDNTALDLGTNAAPPNSFLVKEIENVTRNLKPNLQVINETTNEPIYANLTETQNVNDSGNFTQTNEALNTPNLSKTPNQIIINNQTNLSLSFIDRLDLNNVNLSNQSLYLDDDLNESNIMEIKTITIITKKNRRKSTNPFLNNSDEFVEIDDSVQENPFLKMIEDTKSITEPENVAEMDVEQNVVHDNNSVASSNAIENPEECISDTTNPFIAVVDDTSYSHNEDEENVDVPCGKEMSFDPNGESIHIDDIPVEPSITNYTQMPGNDIVPRRLFGDNSTVSTVNDLSVTNLDAEPYYENMHRPDSPIYSNIDEVYEANVLYNKQSKILGHDVSTFNSRDILNLNPRPNKFEVISNSINSDDSNSKKHDLTHQINKLSKKVLKKIKKTFTAEKFDTNVTLNPYEVPRKQAKKKSVPKEKGFENPALTLNNSDDLDDSTEGEHLYETIKTARNTRLNMNVTPLKECNRESDHSSTMNTSGRKQVRFDSTLNREKVITGNSFEGAAFSPGLDSKIDEFHDELENCINEKKFFAQSM